MILVGMLSAVSVGSWSQIRYEKLVIEPGEQFKLDNDSDIIVADTLILMDGSTLILNTHKAENFVRSKVVIIGNNCTIDGRGRDGQPGRTGRAGSSLTGPCRDGLPAESGTPGQPGGNGVNLYFYVGDLRVNGKLTIDLSGGKGGEGGAGGKGGDGNPGTVHCNGGNGANGGVGGRGGDGGNSGNLVISAPNPSNMQEWIGTLIIFNNTGGDGGRGGKGGHAGLKGPGPANKMGKDGMKGVSGDTGERGDTGTINFEINR
jgi:hypothetical protein